MKCICVYKSKILHGNQQPVGSPPLGPKVIRIDCGPSVTRLGSHRRFVSLPRGLGPHSPGQESSGWVAQKSLLSETWNESKSRAGNHWQHQRPRSESRHGIKKKHSQKKIIQYMGISPKNGLWSLYHGSQGTAQTWEKVNPSIAGTEMSEKVNPYLLRDFSCPFEQTSSSKKMILVSHPTLPCLKG